MGFPHACPIADRYRWLDAAPRSDGQTYHGGPLTVSRGLVLHVQAGNGEPANWWTSPADRAVASSHFWIAKDGTLVQYVGCDEVAWAEVAGNGEWHSAETEGYPGEPLTDAQLATAGRLYAWGVPTFGWALSVTDDPQGHGLGTHGMGGAAWGGHTGCPGPLRAGQRGTVIALAGARPIPPHPLPPVPPVPAQPWHALRTYAAGDRDAQPLQRFLNRFDWEPVLPLLPVTGFFGPQTTHVLAAAQAQCGVRNGDGSPGDGTVFGEHTKQAFYARGYRG